MSRPLRIAHLAFSAQPASVGGLEVVVDRLIRQQIALGHDVTLVTRWKQWKVLQRAGFPYRSLPLPPRLPASKSSSNPNLTNLMTLRAISAMETHL
jgi:glycosyltransferase involved in cell wall biosynthesis